MKKDEKNNLYEENNSGSLHYVKDEHTTNNYVEIISDKKPNFNSKNNKSKKNSFKYFIIYLLIIIGIIVLLGFAKSSLENSPKVSKSILNDITITSNNPNDKPIKSDVTPISTFNSQGLSLNSLSLVKFQQNAQLSTFSDKLHPNFNPTDYKLDPMSTKLINQIYVSNGADSSSNPLTVASAQSILSGISIPFSFVPANAFNSTANQNGRLMLTLDKNLYVTKVLNEPSRGLSLASFYYATQLNNGQLITVHGMALLTYLNNGWNYSRMVEQKSIKTYKYLTNTDLINMFNNYMINADYSLNLNTVAISDVKVVNPYVITAVLTGKGISTFANGQINKSNINNTWDVTFVKDRNSMVSTDYLKLIVGHWNVYKADPINN
ncbi:MAG: hypothetical protein ACRC6T_15330 [Sarcina sp.]